MSAINYDAVLDLLTEAGLVLDGPLQINTPKLVRTKVVDQKPTKKQGYYRLWEVALNDGRTCILGGYGLWLGAEKISYKVPFPKGATKSIDPAVLAAAKARQRAEMLREEQERQRRASRAAQQAAAWWAQCQDAGRSPYLERKGFGPGQLFGARISPARGEHGTVGGNLVIPLLNGKGAVQGLQVIYHDPEIKKRKGRDKDFAPPGLVKAGHWFQLGSPFAGGLTLLCEGFATGCTLHEATSLPVIVAFDAGNLAPVAKAISQRYRGIRILICADDDYLTTPNTGIVKAQEAALALGDRAAVAIPDFAAPTHGAAPIVRAEDKAHKGPTDYNDLHVHPQGGLHAVRAQIELALTAAGWTGIVASVRSGAGQPGGARAGHTPPGSGVGRNDARGQAGTQGKNGTDNAAMGQGATAGQGQQAGQRAHADACGNAGQDGQSKHGQQAGQQAGQGTAAPRRPAHGSRTLAEPTLPRRPDAVSQMSLIDIVERFTHIDDGTGEFAFDHWTANVVKKTKIVHMLPSRVRWDDVKDHPRWKSRAVYLDEIGFDPGGEDPQIRCNRWLGWPTAPKPGCCDLLLQTLRYLTEGEGREVYDWVLKWLAYPLQYPGAKMHSALIFHGPQGTGKSRFFESYAAIYGEYGQVLNQGAIEDRFNSDWAERKLFVVCDEVVARAELFAMKNQLKNLITGEWIRVNPKNVAAHRERNHMNLVFLSNEGIPSIIEKDDRRHLVVWTPPKLDESWYEDLSAEIANGGIAALHHYLLHLNLGDFKPWSRPPMTASKQQLIDVNRESVDRFLEEWQEGNIDGLPLCPAGTTDVYQAYLRWCRQEGVRFPRESNQFNGYVVKQKGWQRVFADRYDNAFHQGPTKRQRMYLPSDDLLDLAADRGGPGDDHRKPVNLTRTQWLTNCYFTFKQALKGGFEGQD